MRRAPGASGLLVDLAGLAAVAVVWELLSLVLGILALILVNRRFSASLASAVRRPNPALAVVLAVVTGVLAVAFFLPPAAGLFGFSPPGPWAFAAAGIAVLVVLLVLERLKPVRAPTLAG